MLRIRAERLKRHWSQTDLGGRARVATSDVSRIENGRLIPYERQISRLARALKLRPDQLLEPVEGE